MKRSHATSFTRDQRGSVLILGAAAIFMLMALTGGAIDIARYINVNSKFKDAADSALLAAAAVAKCKDTDTQGGCQEADEVAKRFFEANFPPEYSKSLVLNDIKVTTDPVNLEWSATVDGEVQMQFAQFVGFDTIKVSHTVKVAWDISKNMEVVFTVDTSASMCMDVVRSTKEDGAFVMSYRPDYRCTKLNAMKEAMYYTINNGLSAIEGMGGPAFYAGIIPFNHKLRLPNPAAAPTELVNSEKTLTKGDPKYYQDFDGAEPLSPVVPLKAIGVEADKEALLKSIRDIAQSPTGDGWTRSNIATLAAALMLDKDHYAAFGGAKPADFQTGNTDKVVVMMTDGANMGCCYAAHPEGNFDNQYLYLYQADNAHLTGIAKAPDMKEWAASYGIAEEGLCDAMKKKGITIYSVVYDVDDRDPGGKEIKDAYKQCASSPQFFFDVMDEEDLQLAYKTISNSFLKLRIIY